MATFVDTDKEQADYELAKKKRQSESADSIFSGMKNYEKQEKETKRKKALDNKKNKRKKALEEAFGPMIA
jgi:tRNA A37 threonylcarbamoyltransferase TsaD